MVKGWGNSALMEGRRQRERNSVALIVPECTLKEFLSLGAWHLIYS